MEPENKPNTAHALASLISAFESQNLPAKVKKQSSCCVSKSLRSEWSIKESKYFTGLRFPSSDEAVREAFKAKIAEYSKQNPLNASLLDEFNDPRTKAGVDDQFVTIDSLNEVFGDASDAKVEHKAGEILFIDVWATWGGLYQEELMQHNKEIKEKYGAKWGEKVRIICISVDFTKEDAIKRINERNWKNLEHYYVEGGWKNDQHNIKKNYQLGIPYRMLINQDGKIVWIGDSGEEKVEEKIENLLGKQGQISQGEDSIPRETYKKLKSFMKNDFIKERLGKNGGKFSFDLKLNRTVSYDASEKKLSLVYEKPTIKASCSTKNEKILREVLNLITNNFNEDVLKTNLDVEDKSADITEAFKILVSALESVKLPTKIEVDLINDISLSSEGGEIVLESNKQLVSRTNIISDAESIKKITALRKNWLKFLARASPRQKGLLRSFIDKCSVQVGNDFHEFEVEDAYSDDKSILRHEKGEVLLVDFWSTGCQDCQGPMGHNQEMLEKNKEAWADKVRIVGVSQDDSKEDLLKRVNEKKWTSVKHFFIGKDRQPRFIYGVKWIPHVVLVDKAGKIVFSRYPSDCKLEKEIQNLLEDKPFGGEAKEAEAPFEVVSKVKKTLYGSFQKELEPVMKGINYLPILRGSLKLIKTFSTESLSLVRKSSIRPNLTLEYRETELPALEKIIENLKQEVGEGNIDISFKGHKVVNLEFGTECNNCQAALTPEQPQFVCYSCKIYFCDTCADKRDETKQGNASLIHPHNLVYISVKNGDGLNGIDELKFGNNVQHSTNIQDFGGCCYACEKSPFGGPVFICLNCNPGLCQGWVNICYRCMNNWRTKPRDSEENLEFSKHLSVNAHKHNSDSHVFLRIYYATRSNY